MDTLKSSSRSPSRWKTFGTLFLSVVAALVIGIMMWKSYLLAATALGSGSAWGRPTKNELDVDSYDATPRLRFENDGTFKVSIFEDLHFGEGEDNPPEWGWGPISDKKSAKVIRTILNAEKPNLAVLNGDLITGENTHFHNATEYLDQIVEPLVKRQIPWASTYGNHDREFNLSATQLLLREKNLFPMLSLTRKMVSRPEAGVTNYVLPVFPSDTNDTIPALLLWFFDSGGGNEFQKSDAKGKSIPVPGFVHPSVVNWFEIEKNLLRIRYNRTIPSLAFVHIPIYAMNAFQSTGVGKHTEPGINVDNPLSPQAIKDGVYTGEDIPFMKSLVNTKGLKAVFSGHDHGDDWCSKWNTKLPGMSFAGSGFFMCFGRHTGYGGYGSWTRGSRQILLHEETLKDEIETWIRLEDENVGGWVMLNGTYGKDLYPAVKQTETH